MQYEQHHLQVAVVPHQLVRPQQWTPQNVGYLPATQQHASGFALSDNTCAGCGRTLILQGIVTR